MSKRNMFARIIVLILVATVLSACQGNSLAQLEENKALVTRFYEEVWNRKNLDINEELFDIANYVHHDPPAPDYIPTVEEAKQRLAVAQTIVPDIQYSVEEMIAEGDKVVVRWTARGTHLGDIPGMPATGKGVTLSGITIYRIADGKIVESWNAQDNLHLQKQLGTIPSPGEPSAKAKLYAGEDTKSWTQAGLKADGEEIFDGFPECRKDDIFIAHSGGTYTIDEGATKCEESREQIKEEGIWFFGDSETKLVTHSERNGTLYFGIVELTAESLKLKLEFEGKTYEYTWAPIDEP